MTYLITGGAGFIGSNFVKHMLRAYPDSRLVVFDALTYAENLGTLRDELKEEQVTFEAILKKSRTGVWKSLIQAV